MELLGLLSASFVLGLTGGIHCLAMCTGLQQAALSLPAVTPGALRLRAPNGNNARMIPILQDGSGSDRLSGSQPTISRLLQFHAGRLLGYALLGAVVASASSALRWGAGWAGALHTLWVLLNAAVLSLGLALAVRGAMPAWIDGLTHRLWRAIEAREGGRSRGSTVTLGMTWALLPCGLLGGAMGLALLASDASRGAAVMASFGLGTAVHLIAAQSLLNRWLRRLQSGDAAMQRLGVRLSGLLLCAMAAMALWAIALGQAHPFCAS